MANYSGWELIDNESVPLSNDDKRKYSDWVLDSPPQQKESFGEALVNAPGRIWEDVSKGAMHAYDAIPGYYQQAKAEIPGALDIIQHNPQRAGQQLLGGLAELGHGVLNTPRGIADYLSNRLNLLSPEMAEKVPYQQDIAQDINNLLGEPLLPGDRFLRGATRNILNTTLAGKTASVLNPLNLTAKSIAKDIVKTAGKNQKSYTKHYNELWKEAEKKGYGNLSHIKNDIDMKTLKKYSPEKSIDAVNDFIKNPTVQNAHAAKSDLLKMQRELSRKTTLQGAERKQYNAVSNAINTLRENMFKNTEGKVNNQLLKKYNKIQTGYSKEVVPYKNKAINEYKRNERSAKELVNALSHGKFAAQRGLHHPEMHLRKYVLPSLLVGGGYLGKNYLNELLGNRTIE